MNVLGQVVVGRAKNTGRVRLATVLGTLAAFGASFHAGAAEWRTSAGVTPGMIYTDNVCLSHENEQGELIGLVTPDISLSGTGRRANLSLAASLEINSLTDSKLEDLGCNPAGVGNREQVAPRLRASGDSILIEDWFYIDANASVDQNEVNPFGDSGNDGLNRTGNTNTTARYRLSPYLQHRFGEAADLFLRYSFDDQYNSEEVVGDSRNEGAEFRLGNSPEYWRLLWGFQASYDNIEYEETDTRPADNSELASAQFNLGYQVNRSWQVNGHYGEEFNDFVSVRDDIDGDFWDIGIRWTPNSRTTVDAGTGQRFFGHAPRFSIQHRHKRSVLSASYLRSLTYDRNLRTRDDFLPSEDEFGQPVDPTTGLPVDLSDNRTTISNSPILDERFELRYVYKGRRNSLHLTGFHSNQIREEDGRESLFQGARASLSHNLSRYSSLNGSVSWDEQSPKTDDIDPFRIESETWRYSLGLQRDLTSHLRMSFIYLFTDRDSERVESTYTENRITLTFRYRF